MPLKRWHVTVPPALLRYQQFLRSEVRNAGYTDEQIIEIVATVALATFTNYMNDFMGTEVDLPVQEPTDGS